MNNVLLKLFLVVVATISAICGRVFLKATPDNPVEHALESIVKEEYGIDIEPFIDELDENK